MRKSGIVTKIVVVVLAILLAAPVSLMSSTHSNACEYALYCKTVKKAEVRKGPGYNYKVIGTIPADEILSTVCFENGWAKVAYGMNYGYIDITYMDSYVPVSPEDLPDAGSLEFAKAAFELINSHRVEIGREPLVWSDEIYAAAQIRATEIETLWSHARPDGRRGVDSIYDRGFDKVYRGENLAKYANSPEILVNGWLNSPGHRRLIESEYGRQAAVAVHVGADGQCYSVFLVTN